MTGSPPGSTTTSPPQSSTPPDIDSDASAVAWQQSLGDTVEHPPAIAGDTVVVAATGAVYGLAVSDGSVRWQVATDLPTADRPIVANGTAYLIAGETSLNSTHTLYAIDVASGEVQWRFQPDGWWLDLLTVDDGRVYVGTADDYIQDTGETLYAFATDGSQRWQAEIGDPRGAAVGGNTVAVGCRQTVYAFDTGGTRRWRAQGPEYQFRTLAATPDTVAYVGSGDEPTDTTLYALAADTGTERWTVGDWFMTSTRLYEGTLYAGGKRVAAFDPATGDRLWETAEPGGSIYDAPVVDGHLIGGSRPLAAYDLATGDVAWRFDPDTYLPRATAAVGGTVLVHASHSEDDRNRIVHGIDAATGTERWTYAAETGLTEPVVVGDRAVAGSGAGEVYAFAP